MLQSEPHDGLRRRSKPSSRHDLHAGRSTRTSSTASRRCEGIADAEARRSVTVRLLNDPTARTGRCSSPRSRTSTTSASTSSRRESGGWPPGSRRGRDRAQLARAAAARRGPGAPRPDRRTARPTSCTVTGISHEVGAAPAFYAGRVAGHVTPETLQDLGFDTSFDELRIQVADPTLDQDGIRVVADEVIDARLERAGVPVFGSYVPVPGRHPANDLLQGFFLVLGVHRRAGARRVRVPRRQHRVGDPRPADAPDRDHEGDRRPERPDRRPLPRARARLRACSRWRSRCRSGALGAYGFAQFTAGLANFDIDAVLDPARVSRARDRRSGSSSRCSPRSCPIYRGVRITVREALASTGIADRFGRGRFDRLLRDIRGPAAADAALDPQHVPAQGPAAPDARRAGPRRRDLHVGVLGPRVARQDPRRHARLLRLRRPGGAGDDRADVGPDRRGAGGAGRRRRRAVAVRARPRSSTPTATEGPHGRRVRPAARREDRPAGGPGGSLAAARTTATRSSRRRTSATTSRTSRSATRSRCGSTARTRRGRWSGIVQSPTQRPFLYAPDAALERATSEVGRAGVLMVDRRSRA